MKISAVIITFNEEQNIARCLESLQGVVEEIIVLDSFSTDKTQEICSKYPVTFIQRAWEGYSKSKNFANLQAQNNCILSLDADEVLSEELRNSILKFKDQTVYSTASLNRLTNYCGKWIKHGGWYPDKKIRIFDKSNTSWQGEIHEELHFKENPQIFHLEGECLHYTFHTIEQHYKQASKFTTIAAQDLFERGQKTNYIKLYLSPVVKFIRDYFFKLGFLDGKYGFVIARISAKSTFLKYNKLKNLNGGFKH